MLELVFISEGFLFFIRVVDGRKNLKNLGKSSAKKLPNYQKKQKPRIKIDGYRDWDLVQLIKRKINF